MSLYSIKFISLLLQACLCVYVNWRNDEWIIVYMGFFYDVVFFFHKWQPRLELECLALTRIAEPKRWRNRPPPNFSFRWVCKTGMGGSFAVGLGAS